MGIENRDYYRESSYYHDGGGWSVGTLTPACKYLLIVTIAVFLLQIFGVREYRQEEIDAYVRRHQEQFEGVPREQIEALVRNQRVDLVQNWLELDADKVLRGQIWRLLTCDFCHDRGALLHIVFNMLVLSDGRCVPLAERAEYVHHGQQVSRRAEPVRSGGPAPNRRATG